MFITGRRKSDFESDVLQSRLRLAHTTRFALLSKRLGLAALFFNEEPGTAQDFFSRLTHSHAAHSRLLSYSRSTPSIVASFAMQPKATAGQERLMIGGIKRGPQSTTAVTVVRSDHEPLNRFAHDQSIHDLRDVRDRNASVKKVVGFD